MKLKDDQIVYPELKTFFNECEETSETANKTRMLALYELASFISKRKEAKILFIDTDNSERSHLLQVLMQALGLYCGIEVECYSGGVNPSILSSNFLATVHSIGFKILPHVKDYENSQVYEVYYSYVKPELIVFSKHYSHDLNPASEFCAVISDRSIMKSELEIDKLSLKIFLPLDDLAGDDCMKFVRSITTELLYMFSLVKEMRQTDLN